MVSVVAGDGPLAEALVGWYRERGADLRQLSFEDEIEAQLSAIPDAVDLLVIADGFEPATGDVDSVNRDTLAAAMQRLTFLPFRVASLLQSQLGAAKGRVVLVSRSDARMAVSDHTGRYLERPFRAAAHALWRCLSVEWREKGISVDLVAVDSGTMPSLSALVAAIENHNDPTFPVELKDVSGTALGW